MRKYIGAVALSLCASVATAGISFDNGSWWRVSWEYEHRYGEMTAAVAGTWLYTAFDPSSAAYGAIDLWIDSTILSIKMSPGEGPFSHKPKFSLTKLSRPLPPEDSVAVPEPSPAALFALGAAGVVALRRRKKR